MSLESSPNWKSREHLNFNLFPIAEEVVSDSIAWLNYYTAIPRQQKMREKAKYMEDDKKFTQYVNDMQGLRNRLHLTSEQKPKYKVGVLYGLNLIELQSRKARQEFKGLNLSACKAYFKSLLLEDDDNITSGDYLKIQQKYQDIIKRPLSPSLITNLIDAKIKDESIMGVTNNFVYNSREKIGSMLVRENEIKNVLPAVRNLIDEDSIGGFLHGVADIYWPFCMNEVVGPYVDVAERRRF